jgi:presequence protease
LFGSYRDPNVLDTLRIYRESSSFLRDLVNDEVFAKEQIEQSIIGTVGDMDSPMTPSMKGITSLLWYLSGRTTETRQRLRDGVLDTSIDDIVRFGDALDTMYEDSSIVVVGSKSDLENANEVLRRNNEEDFKLISPLD